MGFFSSIGNAVGGVVNSSVGNLLSPILGGDSQNLLGDALTGGAISNNQAITQTNAQNIAFAQKQMDFQKEMSNTAYQRAVADMKAAGLNPMLAYSQGGASVPSGTLPTLQAPRPGDKGAGLLATAKEAASLSAGLANTNADTDLKGTTAKLNAVNADVAEANVEKVSNSAKESEVNTNLARQQIQTEKARTQKEQAAARMAKAEVPSAEARSQTDASLSKFDAYLERATQAAGLIGSAFRAFTSGKSTKESTTFNRNTGEVLRETKYRNRR